MEMKHQQPKVSEKAYLASNHISVANIGQELCQSFDSIKHTIFKKMPIFCTWELLDKIWKGFIFDMVAFQKMLFLSPKWIS